LFPLYHDEDSLSGALVAALRREGFDCLTAGEAGMRRRSDAEQLEFATDAGRVIFTHNARDFLRLDAEWHRVGRVHAGIVICTDQRTPVGSQVRCSGCWGIAAPRPRWPGVSSSC